MSPRQQIAAVAQAMLDGRAGLHDGCSEITRLQQEVPRSEMWNEDLVVVVGINSELHDYPVGPARQHWEPSALAEKDRERDEYLRRVHDDLVKACRTLATWR